MERQPKRPILQRCKEFIEKEYIKIDSIKQLAVELGENYHTLRINFKRFYGISLQAYVMEVKLKVVLELLEKTDLPIKEIASRVGMKNPNYLERVFKNRHSISMSIYRRISNLNEFIKSENYSLEKLRSELIDIEFNLD